MQSVIRRDTRACVQQRQPPVLRDNQRIAQWHIAPCSMVAYPWALAYQQSNPWGVRLP